MISPILQARPKFKVDVDQEDEARRMEEECDNYKISTLYDESAKPRDQSIYACGPLRKAPSFPDWPTCSLPTIREDKHLKDLRPARFPSCQLSS
jgi:hypothetical protein